MSHTRTKLRRPSPTAWGPGGGRRLRTATAALLAAVALAACTTTPPPSPDAGARLRSHVDTGLALYADGEFPVAATHFADAAEIARECGEPELEARIRAAECSAWLRARDVAFFARCAEQLAVVQRGLRRSDPGRNTLVALGAVAARRPLPDLRLPDTVRPLVQDVAREFR